MDPYFEGKTCLTYPPDYSYADCDADYVRQKIDAICGKSFKPLWLFSSFNESSYSGMVYVPLLKLQIFSDNFLR